MKTIKLSDGRRVAKQDYISAKTKDLKEYGYSNLTENTVSEQLEKILNKEEGLSVIGKFIQDDILI